MSHLRERIEQTIESEPVVAFIKGTHEQVYCGNSHRALEALRSVGASFTAVDVLPDPQIRQELSALSHWPTIPQVFVGGELVGGADIVQQLAATGELEAKLSEKLGDSWRNARAERTVALTEGSALRLAPGWSGSPGGSPHSGTP
jgi:monothiol glutaredoxin